MQNLLEGKVLFNSNVIERADQDATFRLALRASP